MKEGTQNFFPSELHDMEEYISEQANITGRRLPYHLQYLRDGKPVVKPKGEQSGVS